MISSPCSRTNRLAHTFLGLAAFKAGRYAEAEDHFKGSAAHPIGELTNALALAWITQAQEKSDDALNALEAPKLPDWTSSFVRYHRALLADVAGRAADARTTYGQIPKGDQRILRVALAFAASAANAGDRKLAQGILMAHLEKSRAGGHPQVQALLAEIEAGKRPQLLVSTATEGMSELFFGLGELLASDSGSLGIGVIFLQFSLYLNPNSTFSLVALAVSQEASKRYVDANTTYDRIPKGTPLEIPIEIKKAVNLTQLKKVDEAQSLLEALSRQYPRDVRPLETLGNIMRANNRFPEAVDYYTKAIALVGKPEARHWAYFYARGASYERLKKLPQAEADLRRALQLSPDQADTLNYLGYTWVDHNRYLEERAGAHREGRPAQARQRLHRGQPGLGALPPRQLPAGGEAPRAGRYPAPGRPHPQRSPGRCLLARGPRARGALPVDAGPDAEARAGRCRQDAARSWRRVWPRHASGRCGAARTRGASSGPGAAATTPAVPSNKAGCRRVAAALPLFASWPVPRSISRSQYTAAGPTATTTSKAW